MSFASPSIAKMVENVEKIPSTTLENVLRENALGGIKRFGKRVAVDPMVISFFRKVILDRVRDGSTLANSSISYSKRAYKGSGRYKAIIRDIENPI